MQEKKTYPSHLTLRLSAEEWEQLEYDAAGLSYSEHARHQLFHNSTSNRRTRNRSRVRDHEALGRVLGLLGMTRFGDNHTQLAKLIYNGLLFVSPELETAILEACADAREIRTHLVKALGVKTE